MQSQINKEYLNEIFEYRDGCLYRLKKICRASKVGERAGSKQAKSGYRYIYINNKNYQEHRIIWTYNFGDIETGMCIDHINRVRDDNRIENLRLCTQSQNCKNSKRKESKSGLVGVYMYRGKWKAKIRINGRQVHLGTFPNKSEAINAYNHSAVKNDGVYAQLNIS